MKKLICECCGSHEIAKISSDFYQCQSCGVKYSTDIISTLMVEDAIKEHLPKIEDMLLNAERCLKAGNYGDAYSIANNVLNMDAKNAQALQYVGFSYGMIYPEMTTESISYFIEALQIKQQLCKDSDDYFTFVNDSLPLTITVLESALSKKIEKLHRHSNDVQEYVVANLMQSGVKNDFIKMIQPKLRELIQFLIHSDMNQLNEEGSIALVQLLNIVYGSKSQCDYVDLDEKEKEYQSVINILHSCVNKIQDPKTRTKASQLITIMQNELNCKRLVKDDPAKKEVPGYGWLILCLIPGFGSIPFFAIWLFDYIMLKKKQKDGFEVNESVVKRMKIFVIFAAIINAVYVIGFFSI